MTPGGYRFVEQLGSGADGVAFRAETPRDTGSVEVRVLDRAQADPLRWESLCRRLRRVALLRHPAIRPILEMDLTAQLPYVVLLPVVHPPAPDSRPVSTATALADALAEAHRLGVAHGALGPDALLTTPSGERILDFCGLDVGVIGASRSVAADADPRADLPGLAALLRRLLLDRPERGTDPALALLLADLSAPEPDDRPTAREVPDRIRALDGASGRTGAAARPEAWADDSATVEGSAEDLPRRQLGRYRILEKLGEGGMGMVYRAEDVSDSRPVAVKVLRPDWARDPAAVRRFRKEGRLLGEINNPYVTTLLEINEDAGVNYLALEYVAGSSLEKLLALRGRLEEDEALSLAADVARALVEAHRRGIVHRDIKPENVLLVGQSASGDSTPVRAKLSDFGLARHVVQTESLNLTRAGAVLGTPLYMSPEQCRGEAIDARSDVYSLGATLFHMLAGRPPFARGGGPLSVITQHLNEPPPALQSLNAAVSDGTAQLVAKTLAKSPQARHADAAELLLDLERILRGEPTAIAVHPRRPHADPRNVLRYAFTWELQSPPEKLWPHVSNTERLNRAAGLTPVRFTARTESGGVSLDSSATGLRPRPRRFGEFHRTGLSVAWEEHPFEWVEGRRMGVLREYSRGPFKWLLSAVELVPNGEGTRLTHRVEVEPRGLFGRTLASLEVGHRGRRSLERVYRRIDGWLQGQAADPSAAALSDPFEDAPSAGRTQRRRLADLVEDLVRRGVPPSVADRLGEWVALASPQDSARIRPLALAARLGLDPDEVVAACLHGTRSGLFVLLWDVLCPLCRVPTAVRDTLRLLREHEHCAACCADFAPDFASSVEVIFRVHPEVRPSELATYCVGGPAHSPHVAAQVRVSPGERVELDLSLSEGDYRLRGPQLPTAVEFRVRRGVTSSRLEVSLGCSRPPEVPAVLRPDGQRFLLTNNHAEELVVRIERNAQRSDALTAARASALALFRELFPDEVLSPGQLMSVATVTLLITDLADSASLYHELGDARAFALLQQQFRLLGDSVRAEGGAVVRTLGEGLLAAFPDAASGVRTALGLPGVLARGDGTGGLRLRLGLHRGAALAATVNEQLDYFGVTVRLALALPSLASSGEIVLTPEVAADPPVASLLRQRGIVNEVFTSDLPDRPATVLHRLKLS